MSSLCMVAAVCLLCCWQARAGDGVKAEYVGGTSSAIELSADGRLETTDEVFFGFRARGKQVSVPYDKINLLEYGQNADRRYLMAVVVSPLLILSKSRKHFLTVGYTDPNGKQQAMVFKVGKGNVRAVLVSLEARTGLKVQFQDNEARKVGKG